MGDDAHRSSDKWMRHSVPQDSEMQVRAYHFGACSIAYRNAHYDARTQPQSLAVSARYITVSSMVLIVVRRSCAVKQYDSVLQSFEGCEHGELYNIWYSA